MPDCDAINFLINLLLWMMIITPIILLIKKDLGIVPSRGCPSRRVPSCPVLFCSVLCVRQSANQRSQLSALCLHHGESHDCTRSGPAALALGGLCLDFLRPFRHGAFPVRRAVVCTSLHAESSSFLVGSTRDADLARNGRECGEGAAAEAGAEEDELADASVESGGDRIPRRHVRR